jgi:hypothetical protein
MSNITHPLPHGLEGVQWLPSRQIWFLLVPDIMARPPLQHLFEILLILQPAFALGSDVRLMLLICLSPLISYDITQDHPNYGDSLPAAHT